jgi:hypothetical protein
MELENSNSKQHKWSSDFTHKNIIIKMKQTVITNFYFQIWKIRLIWNIDFFQIERKVIFF